MAPPLTDDMLATIADWFRALSDESRLRLLMMLKENERSVGDLAQELRLSLASTSKQLSILRAARIVKTRREGTTIYYSLRGEAMLRVCAIVCGDVLDNHDRVREGIRAVQLHRMPDPPKQKRKKK